MKAIRYHEYGGPEVLHYEKAPMPEPGPKDVLVRIHAAGVNPGDRQIRAGLRFKLDKPFAIIPGFEISGVVVKRGAEVTELAEGDEVYGMIGLMGGGYAEYVAVVAEKLGRKPHSLDHVQSAALPVAALTIWDALFNCGGLVAGQKMLIHAAAGGMGHIAVQVAKWCNAHVIGTASAGNEVFLRSLGVDEFIDYRTTAFESVVRDLDMVVDCIPREANHATDMLARQIMARSWTVLRDGGIQVSICADAEPGPEDLRRGLHGAHASFQGSAPGNTVLNRFSGLVDEGKIKVEVSAIIPLHEARRAHELIQTGHTRGKIVIRVID